MPQSAGVSRGHDFKTSHAADTWCYAGTPGGEKRGREGGRDRKKRKGQKEEEGIRVSHIDLPQGSLGNYRAAWQFH